MATKKAMNFSIISKRSRCLNSIISESTKVDSQKRFENIKSLIENRASRDAAVQQSLRSYIESICNVENASNYYYQPMELLEFFNSKDTVVASRLLTEFTTRVLPYASNPAYVIEATERYNLTNEQVDTIVAEATKYIAADRILKNHENISNRFNIERECNRLKTVGLKYFIDSCADMIDTYNIKSYQKMNLTLEETCYILEKNGLDYDKQDLVKYVVEYYLVQNPYISGNELANFRKTLESSYFLEEEDIAKVSYLMNGDIRENSIEGAIQAYLINNDKDAGSLANMINHILVSTTKEDIIENVDRLVYLLWDFAKNKTFDSDEGIYDCMQIIARHIADSTKLYSDLDSTNDDYTKEDVEAIINKLSDISTEIETSGNSNPMYSGPAVMFIRSALNPCIVELSYVKDILYSKSNLDAIKFVNTTTEAAVPINEFKVFKFHNLVNAAFNLDKFLKVKERKLYNAGRSKVKNFINKTKNVLFGESGEFNNDLYTYIGEDSKASICIRQYPYADSELEEITSYLESICSEYNDMLQSQNMDSIRAYYTINPGVAEITVKEASPIELSEEDMKAVMEHLDPSIDTYLETFVENSKEYSLYDGFTGDTISEQILDLSSYSNFTIDHFEAALEAMSYLDIDKETVLEFGEKFSEYQFNKTIDNMSINESYEALAEQDKLVNRLVYDWERLTDVPPSIQLEAYGLLLDIIAEANSSAVGTGATVEDRLKSKGYMNDEDEDDEDEDDEEEDDDDDEKEEKKESKPSTSGRTNTAHSSTNTGSPRKKEPKPIINTNSIKLGLMGLKSKFKEMDTKQKEMSQNLDNSVRSIVKAMKDALVSDRREAIIKGSIIPSFSRCIKNAIALAGLGIVTGNIVVPIIVAIGGMAISKELTNRERLLLMDEIETELEVVEKELAIADSNNQIKKYRALLQYKKDLQRQYQRIRYNIRVGKDILPGSAAGMRTNDN